MEDTTERLRELLWKEIPESRPIILEVAHRSARESFSTDDEFLRNLDSFGPFSYMSEIFFDEILTKAIEQGNKELIVRCFAVLETAIEEELGLITEVLYIRLFRHLTYEYAYITLKYMGPHLYKEVHRFLWHK